MAVGLVPSLFQSSLPVPVVPVLAANSSELPKAVRAVGDELPAPERMSLTCTVPAAVPSVFHSSVPVVVSLAAKNTLAPRAVRPLGELLVLRLELMSFTRTVPAAVPSLFHSSAPVDASVAEKTSVDPSATR